MLANLRTFLQEWESKHPDDIVHVEKVSAKHQATALLLKLEKQGKFPIVIFENSFNVYGEPSKHRLVMNLLASRRACSAAMGSDSRTVAIQYGSAMRNRIEPVVVDSSSAPVKEVIDRGDKIDLGRFPIVQQHELDPGPYITAGFVTTYEPDTGIDNCALQRCWVKGRRESTINPEGGHNRANVLKFWERGEDAPVAVWIGHHPAAILGGQAKLGCPESHYPVIGGLMKEPLRLVPTETFGKKLMVPADAEVVLEGYIPREVYEMEGPFGEHLGYEGAQAPKMVFDIRCVTYRRDAIWQDFFLGHADNQIMGGIALEGAVYQKLKETIPQVKNVYMPISGCCRYHAYIQIDKTGPGIAKDAILLSLGSSRTLKLSVVVDKDVDIYDEEQVWWAVATRSQWDRDVVIVPGATAIHLNPSVPDGGVVGAKAGIDATMPAPESPGLPPPYPPLSKIPEEVMQKLRLEDFIKPDRLASLKQGIF